MIRKSVQRFSEKIMLNQKPKARWWFNLIPSRFRRKRLKNKGWEAQKRLYSRPLERRLAFSHIINVQAATSVSGLRAPRLHRTKPGPMAGG
jgi:hypothetical protein